MTLLIREVFVNETRGCRFGAEEWYEPYTDDRGRLFRTMQREYGRCVSTKMYIDTKTQEIKPVGWVFQKRMRYEDARRDPDTGRYKDSDYYVREVWVELRDTPLCARCGKDEAAHHPFTPPEDKDN